MKEVITKELIFMNMQFKEQDEVFRFLAQQLKDTGRSTSVEEVKNGFYTREAEFSTYIDNEIAIPHCRNKSIKDASVAIVINETGIAWTDDGEYPKILFALMIPEANENQMHIRVLAQVAQMIMVESFVESLKKASTVDEIYEMMQSLNEVIQ